MGYTHYWKGNANPDAKTIEALKALVADGYQKGIIDNQEGGADCIDEAGIWFNGIGEGSHETFAIDWDQPSNFEFCKTAHKPYDKYVVAVLVILEDCCDSFHWSSDGDAEDHAEGIALAKQFYDC